MLSSSFPVGLTDVWLSPDSLTISPQTRSWLMHQGSLTERLKQGINEFKVVVLGERMMTVNVKEAEPLGGDSQCLVREVLLYCDGRPEVFARSLVPKNSLTGDQKMLMSLGDKPLGHVLFNFTNLTRQTIEVASFTGSSSVHQLALELGIKGDVPLWGRRSLFTIGEKPLLVAEVFLPGARAYQ